MMTWAILPARPWTHSPRFFVTILVHRGVDLVADEHTQDVVGQHLAQAQAQGEVGDCLAGSERVSRRCPSTMTSNSWSTTTAWSFAASARPPLARRTSCRRECKCGKHRQARAVQRTTSQHDHLPRFPRPRSRAGCHRGPIATRHRRHPIARCSSRVVSPTHAMLGLSL
jgi:hypothetical protein